MFITFQINTEICQVPSNHHSDIFSKVYFWDTLDHVLQVKEAYAGQHCLHKVLGVESHPNVYQSVDT